MSGLTCCIWWFVAGVLAGWLLSWLFNKLLGGGGSDSGSRPLPAYVAPTPPRPPAPPVAPTTSAIDPRAAMIAAAAAAGITVKGEDDLQMIEGIGPKIDALMKENGIHTFAQLSRADIPTISAVLDKGGPRFKLANPGSWAEQAGLAASGKWHELKKLQDELVAGVRMTDGEDA